jgi:hypothetical protein
VGLAQTSSFTYQGRLTDNSLPANGPYDCQFKLFDALSDGAQISSTVSINGVTVNSGVFTVTLDFGPGAFPGAARFLEISVRQGAAAFTTLSPRQPVTATPYAIQTLNAAQLGGVAANQYVLTSDARLSDARPPTAGSANYIQNTTTPQAASDFNISGNGTAGGVLSGNIVNALTQYNLGGSRVLSSPGTNNLFVGLGAGQANTTGLSNVFAGAGAGQANTGGHDNAFFGYNAGLSNTGIDPTFGQGGSNSFFGSNAGRANTVGCCNSFYGRDAGKANTTGSNNSFFGVSAGISNSGNDNSFYGALAGNGNTTGGTNSFFGRDAGRNNLSGNGNTYIGAFAGNLGVVTTNTSGNNNTVVGANAGFYLGEMEYATAIGAGAVAVFNNTVQIGRGGIDRVNIGALWNAAGTMTPVCVADSGYPQAGLSLNYCTSSRRYKTQVQPFRAGLSLVRRLRPVSFQWKSDGTSDLGLIAEEVAAVEPLLNTYDHKGEIEGVKYEQLTVVLINAIKEQQAQLETQASQIKQQRRQLDALRKLVCKTHSQAAACQE